MQTLQSDPMIWLLDLGMYFSVLLCNFLEGRLMRERLSYLIVPGLLLLTSRKRLLA